MEQSEIEKLRTEAMGKSTSTPPTEMSFKSDIAKVHSIISDNIKDDFVLARLEPARADIMIDYVGNAYGVINFYKGMIERETKYKWIEQGEYWEKRKLNRQEIEEIQKRAQRVFDRLMINMTMTAVLNRNVPDNYLIKDLLGVQVPEEANMIKKLFGAKDDKETKETK